jgi:TolB-like protein
VTGELQQILDKVLAKDATIRYQHADEMLADLKRLSLESANPKKNRPVLLAAAAIIIVVGGYFISNLLNDPEKSIQTDPPVVIVLPFKNLGSAEEDYFSDGIREEIGSRLMMFKDLRVISPSSADKYKKTDKSFWQIGQETGADYILEATIRWDKSGEIDRFRITPKLTKTSDNYLMWSDNYEQQLGRIFDVQSEIAGKIVVALGLTLLEPGEDAPDYAPTSNMAAYNFYLRGLDIAGRHFYMADYRESIAMQDSATALDPDFALAWAQKSINHSKFIFAYTTLESAYHRKEALTAAEKALALDPNLPTAHMAMGVYHNMVENDFDKAIASFEAAKSEMTSNAELSEAIGFVKMRQGKWQEALSKFEEAIRIDPLSGPRYYLVASAYTMLRDYESADKYINRSLVLAPDNVDAAYLKVYMNLLQYGSIESGDISFDELAEPSGLLNIGTYEMASAQALGLWRFIIDRFDPQDAIDSVRAMTQVKSTHLGYLNIAQIFDLAGEPDSALLYYDSTRIILNKIIDQGNAEFHAYAEIGITFALMGMADSAIAAGKTAKEIMPVDLCHY